MNNWTFGQVIELVIWLVVYFVIDTLIVRYVIKKPSRGVRKFIYVIGLVITYLIFSTLVNLFGYESQLLN